MEMPKKLSNLRKGFEGLIVGDLNGPFVGGSEGDLVNQANRLEALHGGIRLAQLGRKATTVIFASSAGLAHPNCIRRGLAATGLSSNILRTWLHHRR